jgi:hypothetical protein
MSDIGIGVATPEFARAIAIVATPILGIVLLAVVMMLRPRHKGLR